MKEGIRKFNRIAGALIFIAIFILVVIKITNNYTTSASQAGQQTWQWVSQPDQGSQSVTQH